MKLKSKIIINAVGALIFTLPLVGSVDASTTVLATKTNSKIKVVKKATEKKTSKCQVSIIKRRIHAYSFDREVITPKGFAWTKGKTLNVNGKIYLWNTKENKAELYYHLTNHYVRMTKLGTPLSAVRVNIGDAFIKASDVKLASGKKMSAINTAVQVEDNYKIAASEADLLDLKELINNQKTVKKTIKYKLASFDEKYNYDQNVLAAKSLIKSRQNLSAAQVQYLIWNLKTSKKELSGAKVKS